jgi:hypothetical protein
MEKIENIEVVWDKKQKDVSQGVGSGVFIDGKMLPVASIDIHVGPHGQDYVVLKLHAHRVKLSVEDD